MGKSFNSGAFQNKNWNFLKKLKMTLKAFEKNQSFEWFCEKALKEKWFYEKASKQFSWVM